MNTRRHAALNLCTVARTIGAKIVRVISLVMRPQPMCMSQLDRSGLLYTAGRGSVQRPTLVGPQTGRPLEAMMGGRNLPSNIPAKYDCILLTNTMMTVGEFDLRRLADNTFILRSMDGRSYELTTGERG